MTAVRQWLQKLVVLEQRVDELSIRERGLIAATALTFCLSLWFVFSFEPLQKKASSKLAEIEALHSRIDAVNRDLTAEVSELTSGSAEERRELGVLQSRIEAVNARIGDFAAELIDPAEMTRMLEDVLQQQDRLTLVRVRNLPPEQLSVGEDIAEPRFYRHGIEIVVEGSFAACHAYLAAIEALPWRLYWQSFELDVIEYPNNRIRIEVGTLSLDEEWIGA